MTPDSTAATPAAPVLPPVGARRFPSRGVLAAGLLAALFTLLCVQWSWSYGRLSQDATYDDCTYMFDAGKHLEAFYDGGLRGFLRGEWNNPPHAPFSDFGAVVAFAFFGLHDWVPYVWVNGPVIFLLLLFVNYLGRALRLRVRLLLMVFTLTIPLVVETVHEYRPDYPGAVFTALGVFLVAEAALCRTGRARDSQWLLGGVFFGCALLTKSVFFVHTLTLESLTVGAAAAWLAWQAHRAGDPWRAALRPAFGVVGRVVLPSILLAAPYFLINFHETFGYFYDFALGKKSHISELKGGLAVSAYFYTFGYAGQLILGGSFYVGLVFYALCVGGLLWLKNWRELLLQGFLLLVAAVSLGGIILNHRENQYFGAPAVTLLLFALLRAAVAVWPPLCSGAWGERWALAFLAALSVVSLSLLDLHYVWPYSVPPLNYVVHRDHSLNQRMLDDIWREAGSGVALPATLPVVFVTRGGVVSAPTLRWLAMRAGRPLVFTDVAFEENLDLFRQGLAEATFVVAPEDNAAGVYNQNAAWEYRFEVERLILGNPNLRLLSRYPTQPGGPAYRVFVNDERTLQQFGAFGDFQASEGFMPWEGPYPQWHLGRVRWAVGPGSRFTLPADAAGAGVLRFSVRADQPVRASLLLRGAAVLHLDLPQSPEFRSFTVPVNLQIGANEFTLVYENELAKAADGFQRALLFRQLELQPKP